MSLSRLPVPVSSSAMKDRGNARMEEKSNVTHKRPAATVGSGIFPNVASAVAMTATTLKRREEMNPARVRSSFTHSLRKTAPISTCQLEFKRAEPPLTWIIRGDDETSALALLLAYFIEKCAAGFIESRAWLIEEQEFWL